MCKPIVKTNSDVFVGRNKNSLTLDTYQRCSLYFIYIIRNFAIRNGSEYNCLVVIVLVLYMGEIFLFRLFMLFKDKYNHSKVSSAQKII